MKRFSSDVVSFFVRFGDARILHHFILFYKHMIHFCGVQLFPTKLCPWTKMNYRSRWRILHIYKRNIELINLCFRLWPCCFTVWGNEITFIGEMFFIYFHTFLTALIPDIVLTVCLLLFVHLIWILSLVTSSLCNLFLMIHLFSSNQI